MINRGLKDIKSKSNLVELLKDKGYNSVEEFARDCGCTAQSIFNHIRGNFKPSVTRMIIYAHVLSVPLISIIELFYGDEIKEINDAG